MSYCTTADVDRQLKGASGLRNEDVGDLADHIADAEDWVNAQLEALGYNTPLSSTPRYITNVTAVYAAYIALSACNDAGEFSDQVRDLYRRACNDMEALRKGDATLAGVVRGGTGEAQAQMRPAGVVNPMGGPRWVFGKGGKRL